MKIICIVFVISLSFYSCSKNEKSDNIKSENIQTEVSQHGRTAVPETSKSAEIVDTTQKWSIAVQFINSYIQVTEKPNLLNNWIQENGMTTDAFKEAYRKYFSDFPSGEGPDNDPVLDAQDFDDHGYVLKRYDENTGIVRLKGVSTDFELTVRIVESNGKWLVDGSGVLRMQ